jgi:hypothetical protein
MGQATVDLPDPLQNTQPAPAKSADDLLSQMAGDEIDRLLAETDSEPATAAGGAIATAQPGSPAAPGTADLDAVLETAAAADHPAAIVQTTVPAPAQPPVSLDDSPKIELGDPVRGFPLLLRPLQWLSAPLDPWPDQLRDVLGKVGLMTLINALAVLAYVLLFRRHHH